MPKKHKPTPQPQLTVRLDARAREALTLLTELLGSPSANWTIRFAIVEMAELARLAHNGASLFARIPLDDGSQGEIALSLNQIKRKPKRSK